MVVSKMLEKKTATVDELKANIGKSTGLYIADFTGITVETVTALRANLRKKGIKMKVAKNTLIRRALEANGIKGLEKHLVGPSAIIMADDQDPMAPAKALVEFHKTNEGILPVKVVHIDGAKYEGGKLSMLAKMPGKRELQASVITLALSPGANLLGLIKGPGSRIASQIQAHIEKLGEKSEGGVA